MMEIPNLETIDNSLSYDSDSSTYSDFAEEPATKRHKCTYEDCNKSFYRPSKLVDHIRCHTGERPFKCEYPNCEKAYHKKTALKSHHEAFHLELRKDVMCPIKTCSKVMRVQSLNKHIMRNHNELRFKFRCSYCDKAFGRESELLNHSSEHTTAFRCHICEKVFRKGNLFRRHVKSHKSYKCACQWETSDFQAFRTHKKNCDLVKPRCELCLKYFTSNYNLNKHKEYVHYSGGGTEIFKCTHEGCTRQYNQVKNLRHHIKEHHETGKDYSVRWWCDICQKIFKTARCLKRHQERFHINPLPKVAKPRKPRFDKGVPKTAMITKLTGFGFDKGENISRITATTEDMN